MSERTVTILTDDHGPVTIPEPAWCLGDDHHWPSAFRQDINHLGQPVAVKVWTPVGPRDLLALGLAATPFHSNPAHRGPEVVVHLLNDDRPYDADGLVRLAASLTDASRALQQEVHRLQAQAGLPLSVFPEGGER